MIYFKFLLNHRMSTPLITNQSKDFPVVSTATLWDFHHFERTLGHFPLEIAQFLSYPGAYQRAPLTAPGEGLAQVAGVLHGT